MTSPREHANPSLRLWLGSMLVAVIALLAAGFGYYRIEQADVYGEYTDLLTAINRMKSAQIEEWQDERLGDVQRVVLGSLLQAAAAKALSNPTSKSDREALREHLNLERMGNLYQSVALFTPEGGLVESTDDSPAPENADLLRTLRTSLSRQKGVLSSLYGDGKGGIYIDCAATLPGENGGMLGIVVLRSRAEGLLYRVIRSWPTRSRTAETLLVQREGDEIIFLNELRHRSRSALAFRVPLTRTSLPAVQAALGRQGICEGRDYRDVEVLADVRPVANSPWFIVTKIDAEEVFAAVRYRAGVIFGLVAALIVLLGAVAAWGYKRQLAIMLRNQVEAERRERERHDEFRATLYSIGDGVITTDTAGRVREMNRVAEQLTGWSEAEARGRLLEEVFRIVNEATRAQVVNPVSHVLRDGVIVGLANHTLLIARDGVERPIADSAAPIRADDHGQVSGVVLIFRDQTADRDAVNAMQARDNLLQETQRVASLGTYVMDVPNGVWESSVILDEIWGIGPHFDRSVAGWLEIIAPPDRSKMAEYLAQEVVGKRLPFDQEYRIIRPSDGAERWVHGLGKLECDALNRPLRMVGTIRDITSQKQMSEALRSSQVELAAIYTHAPIIMCLLDEDRRVVHMNQAAIQLNPRGPATLPNLRIGDLLGCAHASDHAQGCEFGLSCPDCQLRKALLDTLETGRNYLGLELQLPMAKGQSLRQFDVIAHTALLEVEGRKRVLLCMTDDSPRKQAAAALREIENKLRQVQKIEAIGQLAGGVAHDFNNILASVLLYLGLLQLEPTVSGEVRQALAEVEKEVHRGASLTKQLLAFSRQQAMELKRVDLNDLLGGLVKMLQRLLGEPIMLSLRHTEGLPHVHADASMLELVVINLCINARDAMPEGGQVTLRTETVEVRANEAGAHAEARDGHFVRLSVTDTGCGMEQKTIDHIFEPFFTTKEVGKGTGLGLATVYGIIKQHGGWVEVQSQVGLGTTFRVYLPVGEVPAPMDNLAGLPLLEKGRNETVLLVEDDAAVRNGLAATLRHHGYQVTETDGGPEALRQWRAHPGKFDLLFTDMVMPAGMTGLDLANQMRADRPDLPVIVYTGYSQALVAQPFDVSLGIILIRKPCAPAELLSAVRQSLAGSGTRGKLG